MPKKKLSQEEIVEKHKIKPGQVKAIEQRQRRQVATIQKEVAVDAEELLSALEGTLYPMPISGTKKVCAIRGLRYGEYKRIARFKGFGEKVRSGETPSDEEFEAMFRELGELMSTVVVKPEMTRDEWMEVMSIQMIDDFVDAINKSMPSMDQYGNLSTSGKEKQ